MSEEIAPQTIQLFEKLEKALNYIRLIESTETTPKIRYINVEPLFNQIKQLDPIEIIEGKLIDELDYLIGKDEQRFKNIKRKYDKVLFYKIDKPLKEKILKSPIDYDLVKYKSQETGEIYTGYSNPNLTIELLHKYYKYWIEFSIDKIIILQEMLEKLIDDYESEYFNTENAIQKFNTNIGDNTENKDVQPSKPFTSYLKGVDIEKIMKLLHEILDNSKTIDFAKFIIALKDLQFIHIPKPRTSLYLSMRNEFGNIGSDSAMNGYLSKIITPTSGNEKISYLEIEEAKTLIENHLKL